MTYVFFIIFFVIGFAIGQELSKMKYQNEIQALHNQLKFWKETAQKRAPWPVTPPTLKPYEND